MRRAYLIYSFIGFVGWLILDKMSTQFKWMALGFAIVMLLLGIFMKKKINKTKEEVKAKEVIDDITKLRGGNKNGI